MPIVLFTLNSAILLIAFLSSILEGCRDVVEAYGGPKPLHTLAFLGVAWLFLACTGRLSGRLHAWHHWDIW